MPFTSTPDSWRSDELPDPEAAHDHQFGVTPGAATRQYALVMPDDFVFSERWWDLRGRTLEDEARRQHFEGELVRELAEGHRLHGVPASAIAACQHCDDVLFEVSVDRYAVVHLSYPKAAPDRPPWPDTDLYSDWEAVALYLAEHEEL